MRAGTLGEVSTVALKRAVVLFAGLALLAGGLQAWAYVWGEHSDGDGLATGGPRHLVLGIFALSVGISVLAAIIRSKI